MRKKKAVMDILVLDYLSKALLNAKVILTLQGEKPGKGMELKFEKARQRYRASDVKPGPYLLQVTAEGFEPQEREVRVDPSGLKDIFILGKKGMPFYFKRNVKVPFEPMNDLLAVAVVPALSEEKEREFNKIAGEAGLRPEKISDEIRENHVRVFRFAKDPGDEKRRAVQEKLERHPLVRRVGPIVSLDARGLSFLTNEFIVRFKLQIPRDKAYKVASDLNLEVVREIPYVPNGYLLRAAGTPGYDNLSICAALVKRGLVEYAEPNLFVTAIRHFTPNDPQFNQQPHHALIESEDAWDHTTGDQNILIAVMDDGCDIDHQDLTNPAGAGWTKVVNPFNFTAYNSTPTDTTHGTRSCGIATAVADNSLGVAGVAPGCQLMPLEWLSGTMAEWSDAYIWIVGGDPGRLPPFPAPLAKGADVISNSIGVHDFPMSGVMKDTWDYAACYGRNGRGCVVVFSAGNDDNNMAVEHFAQWANYEKTIAVAACTISPPDAVLRKVSTSSYGDAIDLCAPAGGPAGGTEARTMSTANANTYATHGQTSCACPQVAGAAALLLSANPDLNWVEVRQILRDSATHIDTANIDADGIWRDVNGTASNAPGYLGPHHSGWYGFGMLNVHDAVVAAENLVGVDLLTHIDTWIKENAADVGNVPCQPPYSPDVWVRNLAPAADDPAHVTEHQNPKRGQDNWVYANVRNRGAVDSHDVYVRIMITRWAGTQYVYPNDFLPTVNPSTTPTVMAPGTYLIGEVHLESIPAGGVVMVNTIWPEALIPPDSVEIAGVTYSWADSCLLVEVSPHDGPAPTGNHTWDNNNLCQKNITIDEANTTDADTFDIAFVVGHRINEANLFRLKIERYNLPAGIKLFVDYIDKETTKDMLKFLDDIKKRPAVLETCDLAILTEAKGEIRHLKTGETTTVRIVPDTHLIFPCCHPPLKPVAYHLSLATRDKRAVFGLPTTRTAFVPVLRRKREYQMLALHGKGLRTLKKGDYRIDISQEDLDGNIEGGINFIIRKK